MSEFKGTKGLEAEAEYQAEVRRLEVEHGWTVEQGENCGCNGREEPCDRCWSLGWAIGGIKSPAKALGEGE